MTAWILTYVAQRGLVAVDFRQDFWTAGWRLLHGGNPYIWTRVQVAGGVSFPYPASTAVLVAPFALLSSGAAGALFTALCVAASLGTLWALSVRDWRRYGLLLVWSPVVIGWQAANVTPAMTLLVALLWRWRHRARASGFVLALLICIKPIALPLGLWLLATRRYAAAGWAAGLTLIASVASWGLVGFGEIRDWLHLLSVQGDLLYRAGYGVIALVADAGLGRAVGTASMVAVSAVLAARCLVEGRRRRGFASFTLAVAMMITVSPQVDEHYLMLLIVPLAIARPTLGPIWMLPLALWLTPSNTFGLWQVVMFWLVAAVALTVCLRADLRPGESLGPSAEPPAPVAQAGRARPSPA
jgi:hypothetical protein